MSSNIVIVNTQKDSLHEGNLKGHNKELHKGHHKGHNEGHHEGITKDIIKNSTKGITNIITVVPNSRKISLSIDLFIKFLLKANEVRSRIQKDAAADGAGIVMARCAIICRVVSFFTAADIATGYANTVGHGEIALDMLDSLSQDLLFA